MNAKVLEALAPCLPKAGAIKVLTATTASQEIDLTTTEVAGDLNAGRMLRFQADGADVYFNLSAISGGTVDETAAGGATAASAISAGDYVDGFLPYTDLGTGQTGQGIAKYLRYKTAAAGTVRFRISVVSEDVAQRQH